MSALKPSLTETPSKLRREAWDNVSQRIKKLKTAYQARSNRAFIEAASYELGDVYTGTAGTDTVDALSTPSEIGAMAGSLAFLTQLTLMDTGRAFTGAQSRSA